VIVTGVPQLPTHIDPVNQTAQWVFTLGQVTPLLISIWLAHKYAKQYRSALPWMFLVGGLLMCMIEPLVDHNGRVWFPTDGQWNAFVDYGVHLPIWLVMAYVWFFGGRAMLIWHLMEQGRAQDPRWLYKHWGLVFVIDAVLENIGLYLGVFLYYGEQPLKFGKFPLWWGAINSTTPIVLAALVLVLRPHLTGRKIAWVIPLSPAVAAAVNSSLGWITWNAINNTALPAAVVWGAGCLTVAQALVLLYLIRALVLQQQRLRAAAPREAVPA
jgi:hypothetical protein